MSRLKLYYATVSTPSRAVLMAIRNMGIDVEVITLNILANEHKTGEFPKINPQMVVPTIVDGDFMLWESKAILVYLGQKTCGPFKGSFYPKCAKTRALILQRLLFDSTEYYTRILDVINTAFGPDPILTQQHKDGLTKALEVMNNNFLDGRDYFVDNQMTLADFAFCASTATLTNFGFDISNFSNVVAWYEKMKGAKGYDQVLSGAQEFGAIIRGSLKNSFDDLK